eukprot:jgi/Chlat1/406/Chrsp10S01531
MLSFDFRNTPLRKKYDSLKYNLNKLESLMYDLSLSSHLLRASGVSERGEQAKHEGGGDEDEDT